MPQLLATLAHHTYLTLVAVCVIFAILFVVVNLNIVLHDQVILSTLSQECQNLVRMKASPVNQFYIQQCHDLGRFWGDIDYLTHGWQIFGLSFLSFLPACLVWILSKWLSRIYSA